MKQMAKKGMTALIAVALISAAGLAQAETRFAVQDSAGTTDKMVVTDKGYVGVGTAAPTTAIQAKGPSYETTQILSHYTGSDPHASGGYLAYRNSLNGSTPILPKANQRIGYMLFGALADDGVSPRNAAGLLSYAEADWTNSSIPAYFLFETAPVGGTGRLERMRINSAGNVGIGTKTPTQKLEVNGALRLNTASAKPATCNAALRGVIWMVQGGTGAADSLEACVKDANGNYAWTKLY